MVDYTCAACDRDELTCSKNPCDAVRMDRGDLCACGRDMEKGEPHTADCTSAIAQDAEDR